MDSNCRWKNCISNFNSTTQFKLIWRFDGAARCWNFNITPGPQTMLLFGRRKIAHCLNQHCSSYMVLSKSTIKREFFQFCADFPTANEIDNMAPCNHFFWQIWQLGTFILPKLAIFSQKFHWRPPDRQKKSMSQMA